VEALGVTDPLALDQEDATAGGIARQREIAGPAEIEAAITEELEGLKARPAAERLEAFDRFGRYWSASAGRFQDGAVGLRAATRLTDDEIARGAYDGAAVARRLVAAMDAYDREVTIPILEQVVAALPRDKPKLHLGRDFAPVYLWAVGAGVPENYLANVSRTIRDQLATDDAPLPPVLRRLGLLPSAAGLFIGDSGKLGKIPAAVFRALIRPMTDPQRYRFLRESEILYLTSRRTGSHTIRSLAKAHAGGVKSLDADRADAALRELASSRGRARIPALSLEPTTPTLGADLERYHGRESKLLEWRPKLIPSSTGFDDGPDGPGFTLEHRAGAGERISSLLGFHADLSLVRKTPRGRARTAAPRRR
jgi:hypothetical protein